MCFTLKKPLKLIKLNYMLFYFKLDGGGYCIVLQSYLPIMCVAWSLCCCKWFCVNLLNGTRILLRRFYYDVQSPLTDHITFIITRFHDIKIFCHRTTKVNSINSCSDNSLRCFSSFNGVSICDAIRNLWGSEAKTIVSYRSANICF